MTDKLELAPESKRMVDLVTSVGPIDLTQTVDKIRQDVEQSCERQRGDYVFTGTSEEQSVAAVDNGQDYTVSVTILRPKLESGDSWKNILIYFHGGGWVWNSRGTHMKLCEMIASECQCVVVNVEYRLSPEHKFPACYTDAQAVVKWCLVNKQLLANNNTALLGVGGDSAGGNIAASVCHLVSGLDYQVLIYPLLTLSDRTSYESYIKYGEGYLLTKQLMAWFTNNFLNNEEERENDLCSPMNRSSFDKLPPALFVVSECDPFADQSPEYQKKLESAGVCTELVLLEKTVHGFVSKPGAFKETMKRTVSSVAKFMAKLET